MRVRATIVFKSEFVNKNKITPMISFHRLFLNVKEKLEKTKF